jgi:hypothetical protein
MSEPVTTWPCDSVDLYEGEIITFKGRLAAVRRADPTGNRWKPSIVLAFTDWSMVLIGLVDGCTARSIRAPLGCYVTVKARAIDEDGTLQAIAMWEPGGVPQPLGKMSA